MRESLDDHLAHYGILRKSGRYPWGSGSSQKHKDFLGYVDDLKSKGMSETEIAKAMSISTTDLRALKSVAKNEQKQDDINTARKLRDKGTGYSEIGRIMGKNESSVRALLAPGVKDKADILQSTTEVLRQNIASKEMIDVGIGVERQMGISKEKLATAVSVLKNEGYEVRYVKVPQLGTGLNTSMKILTKPGMSYSEVYANRANIKQINEWSEDGGRSFLGLKPPLSVSSKRVGINWKEDGGDLADGVIYVRPGVDDISLGNNRYAQVRIMVDGTHYIKGMAMYKDDLPEGTDLLFNTNKPRGKNKLDALKPLKTVNKKDPDSPIDADNPFGSMVRQRIDSETGKVTSAMNIVGLKEGTGAEGGWDTWGRSLSAQMLSKQSPTLAKTQLNMTYEDKRRQFDEIMALTNPSVKKKLLQTFADEVDSSAVHLEAKALPNASWHVILPFNSMKPTEIYAPNFKDGERVALIRYPHGGTFEIPELTVNNRHRAAKSVLGNAKDAVGINSKVAERLSGADFDGDAVLVIPNNSGRVKTTPALEGLKGFDPQSKYPGYEGMKAMTSRETQMEMGRISNLITDMTIRGAGPEDLARAVRHSMVVIDAEKHELDFRRSAVDNGISDLMTRYQNKSRGGASTLISRATSEARVPERKQGYRIDKETGAKIYSYTNEMTVDKRGRSIPRTTKSKKLAETDDAYTLSSGTAIEKVYADHSNKLKTMANDARLAMVNTQTIKKSSSAALHYREQVHELDRKLDIALQNAPRERQAQLVAGVWVSAKRKDNPEMSSAELKKVKAQALMEARSRTGANKNRIDITDSEWNAIQAGAISPHKLDMILNNTDLDVVKTRATPKTKILMTSTKLNRAKSMAASGYTQAEIANALGVSLTTLKEGLNG